MRYGVVLTALLLLLSGCDGEAASSPGSETSVGGSRASASAATADAIKAGRWKVSSISPGMSPQEDYLCVSPQQAISGSFMRGEIPEGCSIERDNISDGKIDFATNCNDGTQTMSSSMRGSYSAHAYTADIELVVGSTESSATSKGAYESDRCQPDDTRIKS